MTPPDILIALVIGLFVPSVMISAWLVLRWAGRAVARKRARLVEPDNCGDDGGHPCAKVDWEDRPGPHRPKAHETGSGLPAGPVARSIFRPPRARDMRPSDGD